MRSDDSASEPLKVNRASCVPENKVKAFFPDPFANLEAAQTAPLKIKKAILGSVPDSTSRMAGRSLSLLPSWRFYAMGPGVCVWLALSELMPTRIRSNGMSVALVLNQLVSTTLAAIFLPFVSKYGYSSMFFLFAGFTVIYFLDRSVSAPRDERQRHSKRSKLISKREEHARQSRSPSKCRDPAGLEIAKTASVQLRNCALHPQSQLSISSRGRSTSTPCSSAIA